MSLQNSYGKAQTPSTSDCVFGDVTFEEVIKLNKALGVGSNPT